MASTAIDLESSFERKYVSAVDLPDSGDVTVTIKNVVIEELENRDGSTTRKPVAELAQPLVPGGPVHWPLNRTNVRGIKSLLGSGDPAVWAGKSVSLYKTTVTVGAEEKDAVRVRKALPAPAGEHVLTDEDDLEF